MKYLDELDIISKLRMFYNGDVFDKMKGTDAFSSLTSEEKRNFIYGKIFNDDSIVNSVSTIASFLAKDETTNNSLADLKSILTEDTSSSDSLFEISIYGHEINTTDTTNSTFGDISWKNESDTPQNYLDSLFTGTFFTGSLYIPDDKNIMLIKVKNDEFHPAYHSTEAAEVFLNYIPVIERSRCSPIFSVDVFTRTNTPEGIQISTVNEPTGPTIDLVNAKQIPNLSALKFLNGNSEIKADKFNTADGSLTLASTVPYNGINTEEKKTNPYVIQRNGMEMFTMPQSLISKTKDSRDIDPFRPFMSIKSAKITTESAGQRTISWNTAELVIEVYDRHRLNDIAYFLDPGNFSFTKLELTAGWKHQDSSSPYGKYIERMISKEMYVLKSSSYTFDDSGVVTVTLSLVMNGAREMSDYSIFKESTDVIGIREAHEDLTKVLKTIRSVTTSINSQRETGNVLPTSVITETKSSSAMKINEEAMEKIKNAIADINEDELSDEDRNELNAALGTLSKDITDYYTELNKNVDDFLKESGLSSGSVDPIIEAPSGDPWEYKYTSEEKWFTRNKETAAPGVWVEPTGATLAAIVAKFPNVPARMAAIDSGETVKFDKLFLNALIKRILKGADSPADEIHIFMYEFNDKCPSINNTYIGDFEINVSKISQKLKKIIEETQNLTFASFAKVINSEMKDKLNPQFKIIDNSEDSVYIKNLKAIDMINGTLNEFKANKIKKEAELEAETKDKKKEAIQKDIDDIQGIIDGSKDLLADEQDKIDEYIKTSENSMRQTQRTSTLDMPDLKIKVESKKSSDGKDILRVHVYDEKSKPNELSIFLSNLNNEVSLESSVNDKDKAKEAKDSLINSGLAYEKESTDTEKKLLVVNTQSHKLKGVIKNIMPSIAYGVEGTAINKASMSMIPDALIQTVFMRRTQKENTSNTDNSQTGESDQDAQRIMPANISLDMMGCPLLRFGQEYFVDFDTNTDLDNVYVTTQITHNISSGVFTTSVQLKPAYRQSISFGKYLSDIQLMTDISTKTDETGS